MPELRCIVVTPEQTVRDESADFVALTLFDGEIGIAPSHTPLIGRLGYGEMRITRGSEVQRYYIEGGFVEVIDDVVWVLTNRAVAPDELDEEVVREQLSSARSRPATTPELMAVRDRAVAQSRAQLRLPRRAGE
jgi:F-type H+-transporting ATPase subunit epsilon